MCEKNSGQAVLMKVCINGRAKAAWLSYCTTMREFRVFLIGPRILLNRSLSGSFAEKA